MTAPEKPHAPATERNRDAILDVLRRQLADGGRVLEIGSGTGQHAVHFARALPAVDWQCSDRAERLPGICLWLEETGLANTPAPIELDVAGIWPAQSFEAVFSANTLHIMSWPEVESLFVGLQKVLAPDAKLIIYGPFKYGGRYTSDSNEQFDQSLRVDDPRRGIRDVEAVQQLATGIGLSQIEDLPMPANNRCLIWSRSRMSAQGQP